MADALRVPNQHVNMCVSDSGSENELLLATGAIGTTFGLRLLDITELRVSIEWSQLQLRSSIGSSEPQMWSWYLIGGHIDYVDGGPVGRLFPCLEHFHGLLVFGCADSGNATGFIWPLPEPALTAGH